jgi:hypothetical protein
MFLSKSEFLVFLECFDPEDEDRKSSTMPKRYIADSGYS